MKGGGEGLQMTAVRASASSLIHSLFSLAGCSALAIIGLLTSFLSAYSLSLSSNSIDRAAGISD